MNDETFLRGDDARHMRHPMGDPGGARASPPRVVTGAAGVRITDIDGHEVIDAVGGRVNLGHSCRPVKEAIAATGRAMMG